MDLISIIPEHIFINLASFLSNDAASTLFRSNLHFTNLGKEIKQNNLYWKRKVENLVGTEFRCDLVEYLRSVFKRIG